jgi:mannose-6-phosphate isomerase-like protein (cupin superfamily)
MNKIFKPIGFFTVPDGTDVSPFLNATDPMQHDVPWGALAEMSIAAGRIGPGVISWIHTHPVVTQVTYLVSGRLDIRMKDPKAGEPYTLELRAGEAVLTEPRTLFQLRNMSDGVANVLYITSPPYVFESVDEKVIYDDAVLIAKTWEDLDAVVPRLGTTVDEGLASRTSAMRRLAARKAHRRF